MPGPIAEAERTVRRARLRLTLVSVTSLACGGLAVGALGGLAGLAVGWLAGVSVVPWVVALPPIAGLLAGAARGLAGAPDLQRAALLLDAAARTEEAFVSSLTATDARTDFRALAASFALERCPPGGVARALPFDPPRSAPLAAVSAALLSALVLVPAGESAAAPPATSSTVAAAAAGSPGAAASPSDRVAGLTDAVRRGAGVDEQTDAARGDLAAVPDPDLRALAQALAERGSEAARRALEALQRGDRADAVAALREALSGSADTSGTGGAAPAAPEAADDTPGPWSAPTWPLRYDRLVRHWARLRTAERPHPLGEER